MRSPVGRIDIHRFGGRPHHPRGSGRVLDTTPEPDVRVRNLWSGGEQGAVGDAGERVEEEVVVGGYLPR